MVLKKVGVVGTASSSDVLEGETFTSETEGGEATGSMPDNGTLTIHDQYDSGGAGYYDSVNNNITDRGSLSNVQLGEYEYAGWYDGGTVPSNEPDPTFSFEEVGSVYPPSDGLTFSNLSLSNDGIIAVDALMATFDEGVGAVVDGLSISGTTNTVLRTGGIGGGTDGDVENDYVGPAIAHVTSGTFDVTCSFNPLGSPQTVYVGIRGIEF